LNTDYVYVGSNQILTGDANSTFSSDGFQRDDGQIVFNNTNGTVTLRGTAGGSSQSNLSIGALVTVSPNTPTATLHVDKFDVSGHTADLAINHMIVGKQDSTFPIASVYSLDA